VWGLCEEHKLRGLFDHASSSWNVTVRLSRTVTSAPRTRPTQRLTRPPPIQKLGAENRMLQLHIQCSWWWAYVPETCRAKNTLIKLRCCIKLAFQVIWTQIISKMKTKCINRMDTQGYCHLWNKVQLPTHSTRTPLSESNNISEVSPHLLQHPFIDSLNGCSNSSF